MKFPRAAIIEELKREIGMRKKVYPDSVRVGRLTKIEADRRIEILEDLVKELEGQGEMFPPTAGN